MPNTPPENSADSQRARLPAEARVASALELSIVLPAYNESARLPHYLDSIRRYLDSRCGAEYEVIVVDDGSSDHLGEVLADQGAGWPQLTLIRHPQNRGKGSAVRTGVLAASGDRILFADADGATPVEEEEKLSAAIAAGADVAVGSRLLVDDRVVRRRSWHRAVIGRTFAAVARRMFSLTVRDTQCGFKMFRRAAAKRLFTLCQETGYLFDIEILALAGQLGYRVCEVSINWSDQPGSRMQLRTDAGAIISGLWRVRHRLRRLPFDYDMGSED